MISFDDGAMTFPEVDLPDVARAAHEVMFAAQAAGVWVTGAGMRDPSASNVVAVDGTVTEGPTVGKVNFIGGFCILETETPAAALARAAKFAAACRCAQEVRAIMDDPLA